jgi:hypothetical protein
VTQRQARQLHLFKGLRQRGIRPPAPSEFQIHVAVADVLRRWALPTVEWVHVPLGEFGTAATAGELARMGAQRSPKLSESRLGLPLTPNGGHRR